VTRAAVAVLAIAVAATVVAHARVAAAQPTATVHGSIVDKDTHAPVGGVVVTAADQLAASDDNGAFELTLPPGQVTIELTADFIVPTRQTVVLGPGETRQLTFEVAARQGGETITVESVAPTAPGEITVDAQTARAVPGGGGDAAKVVQSLPSVARPSAGSTDIVIWGAAPNETRVFVDGVPVPALYHQGGYRSAVGNDLIGDIHLTPAAFGVDRGGAIGGVIDIGLADPSTLPQWRVQADVLDASAEGRTTVGAWTLAAAVRQSYLDQVIGLVVNPQQLAPNAPLPKWSDGQIAARAKYGDVTVTSWLIGSIDTLDRVLVSDDPADQTDEHVDQRFVRGEITVRRDRPDGYDSATVWAGYDRDLDNFLFGLIPADRTQRDWVAGARGVQQQRFGDHVTLTTGLDLDGEYADLSRDGSISIPAREGDIYIFGQPPGDDVNSDAWNASTTDAAGYAAVDLRASRFSATLGLRADAWLLTASRLVPRLGSLPPVGSQLMDFDGDPRVTMQLHPTDELTLRADAGIYHQARDVSDTSAVFGNPTLGIEEGDHAIVGAQWRRGPGALEVAAYGRLLQDLVARNPAVTPPLADVLDQAGSGHVEGVQVTARLVHLHGFSGWLSYNLSRSIRQDTPDGSDRFFDHDQTNGLIAVGGWEHGPWTLGGRVRYATGEPRTPVIGAFFDSVSGRFEPLVGAQNSVRLPAYFAADARAERRFGLGHGLRGAVYLEVQNLTDRANAEEIIYNADFTQKGYLTGLPLLAIAGVRLESPGCAGARSSAEPCGE
jgi:hypothetical protein